MQLTGCRTSPLKLYVLDRIESIIWYFTIILNVLHHVQFVYIFQVLTDVFEGYVCFDIGIGYRFSAIIGVTLLKAPVKFYLSKHVPSAS